MKFRLITPILFAISFIVFTLYISTFIQTDSSPDTTTSPPGRIIESLGFPMVYVPEGRFQVGTTLDIAASLCELLSPIRFRDSSCNADVLENNGLVTFSQDFNIDSFYMDVYEISVADYLRCVDSGICSPDPVEQEIQGRFVNASIPYSSPVTNIPYYDAAVFCATRSARLPTLAEWEYAARGPDNLVFPWGNDFDGTKANFCDMNCAVASEPTWNDGFAELAPVDSFSSGASWIGAYNMAGNAAEWTSTRYGTGVGTGSVQGLARDIRVVKGGSYMSLASNIVSWEQLPVGALESGRTVGFRCVRNS